MSKLASLSLRQQVTLVGGLVFGLALCGIAFGHWLSARSSVHEQLSSQAQETATALALSLSSALRNEDAAMVRTTLLPVVDRGYFRNIVVRNTDGKVIDSLALPDLAEVGVPEWFRNLVGLDAPVAEAMVTAGWQQVGRVEVQSHPQFALRQLWRDTLQTMGWLALAYVCAMLMMSAWLRQLMAPLNAVENAALSVSERRFQPIPENAKARELQRFIAGFNRLVNTVNQQLSDEERRAEFFRERMLTDTLTGLPNRAALDVWLAALPVNPGRWLALIEVDGMIELNRAQGYGAGDQLVVGVASALRDSFPGDCWLARLGAATFVVVHMANGDAGARLAAARAMAAVSACLRSFGLPGLRCAGGWVPAAAGGVGSQMLGMADRAAAMARAQGSGHFGVLSEDSAPPELRALGANAWLSWVDRAISDGTYSLAIQNICAVPDGHPIQREIFLRLHGEGGMTVPAQTFLPLVQRAGEADVLDRRMLELLAAALRSGEINGEDIAVNLSATSWRSEKFCQWLLVLLESWPSKVRPVFELNEADVAEDMNRAANFAEAMRAAGANAGIDHFGVASGGIAALRKVLPCYVKLDASMARNLEVPERRFQVEALVRVARTLDIPVWAQVFGDDNMLAILADIGISGAQGYVLAAELPVANA